MGPRAFITCYVCFREYGSRSIPFHEPKCLERWRASNRSLPPDKRSTTPVKPVGWKHNTESTWLCTNCQVSVPAAKRGEHAANCFGKPKSGSPLLQSKTISNMAAGTKVSSPKKGKENKNNVNNNKSDIISRGNNIMNDHSIQKPGLLIKKNEVNDVISDDKLEKITEEPQSPKKEISTSNRSVRPQTKILRRPTPNLKHPIIQVDSDESGDNSDKSKDETPKRMKHSNCETSGEQKPKNFIMYNKYNVDKNIKSSPKERVLPPQKDAPPVLSTSPSSIPHPCNSCNRSVAPERLHSHVKKDTRSFTLKKSTPSEAKTPSPQKKVITEEKNIKEHAKNATQESSKEGKKERSNDDIIKGVTGSPKALVINSVAKKNYNQSNNSKACYICGREPGPFVLPSHEAKCLERWKKENNLLSPTRRKPSPKKLQPEPEKKPDVKKPDITPNTLDPAWQAVQAQLVPCPSCGRTFFPERLPIHQRVCKGKPTPGQSLVRANSLREQSIVQGDEETGERTSVYVPCYICGRNFGSWVIQMHESQCLRKWRRENEKLAEHLQQQEPHKPVLILKAETPVDLEEAGDVAWESHLQQLVPCKLCSRTFFPDRLSIHQRSCKGPVPNKQQTPQSLKGDKAP